jgi:hypothetical protein
MSYSLTDTLNMAGVWYHLAVQISGSTARVFVNGVQTATCSNMGGALGSVVHYFSNFGTDGASSIAQAGIDEIKF